MFALFPNTLNDINLGTDFCCAYSQNRQNEIVHMPRISGMKLNVYIEYTE
jgi:hypothetical protein